MAEANNFPFLEPFLSQIEDGKYYEFVLIRTDTTRGPKSVKGNENHIFALVLIFFRLDYEEEPQRNTSVYRLARILVVRPRAYAEDTLRTTSRYKASVARVVKTRIKTCCKHKPLRKTSVTLRHNVMLHWTHKGCP